MDSLTIRSALPSDAKALLGIYSYYVENTAISLEYTSPTAEEFRARIEKTLKTHPYLVAECKGEILGYAYAGLFRTRAAYSHSAELSIYIKREHRGKGLGRRLYEELEARLCEMGIENFYVCIAFPRGLDEQLDTKSPEFHAHMGYTEVAHFNGCARKFGKLYDMIFMEKRPHDKA